MIETSDSGVICIDLHFEHPSLIAVGHYNGLCFMGLWDVDVTVGVLLGTVAVYDVTQSCREPQFKCDARTGQHLDPVWEVGVSLMCWELAVCSSCLQWERF